MTLRRLIPCVLLALAACDCADDGPGDPDASGFDAGDADGGNDASSGVADIEVRRGLIVVADGATDDLGTLPIGVAQPLVYTVSNTGTATLGLGGSPALMVSATTNCTATVTLPPASTVPAQDVTSATLSVTVTGSGSFSFVLSIPNDDPDESPYDITVSGTAVAPTPEIEVFTDFAAIADGSSIDLPARVAPDRAFTQPVVIRNVGTGTLTLSGNVTTSGSAITVRDQPSTSIAPGDATVVMLLVSPGASGSFTTDVSILSDDSDEATYDFTLDGSVLAPTSVLTTNSTNDLVATTVPGATPTTISPAIGVGASGPQQIFHLESHALFTGQFASPGAFDLYFCGIPPALPASSTNVSQAFTGSGGYVTDVRVVPVAHTTASARVFAIANDGTRSRLIEAGIDGDTLTATVDRTGTFPSGSPTGVVAYSVSPRRDLVAVVGDLETAGTREVFVLDGSTRTKVSSALGARLVSTASLRFSPDGDWLVYETETAGGTERDLILVDLGGATPTTMNVNGAVPSGRPGVIAGQTRFSAAANRLFFVSNEDAAQARRELYAVSLVGGSASAAVGVNGATIPGAGSFPTGVSAYVVSPDGTRVVSEADSGFDASAGSGSASHELRYTTFAGTTPTTVIAAASTTPSSVGARLDTESFVSNDIVIYTHDVASAGRPDLYFLQLGASAATVVPIAIPGVYAGGATGIPTSGFFVHADGATVVAQTDRGAAAGNYDLYAAPIAASSTPVQLNPSIGRTSMIRIVGQSVFYRGFDGMADRVYRVALTGGTPLEVSGNEVNGFNGVIDLRVLSLDRVVYMKLTATVDQLWTASATGPTRTLLAGGQPSNLRTGIHD